MYSLTDFDRMQALVSLNQVSEIFQHGIRGGGGLKIHSAARNGTAELYNSSEANKEFHAPSTHEQKMLCYVCRKKLLYSSRALGLCDPFKKLIIVTKPSLPWRRQGELKATCKYRIISNFTPQGVVLYFSKDALIKALLDYVNLV